MTDTLRIAGTGLPDPGALRFQTLLGCCAVIASLVVPAVLWVMGAPLWLVVLVPVLAAGWMLLTLPAIRANAMERASVVLDLGPDAVVINSEPVAWEAVTSAALTVFGSDQGLVAADLRVVSGRHRVVARLPRTPVVELREVYYHLEARLAPYGVVPDWRCG